MKKSYTYLLLGSNLGNREKYLEEAISMISMKVGMIIDRSSVYETAPWGFDSKESFLNCVIRVQTEFTPETVLHEILQIEQVMGRIRTGDGYSSRVIDIDILFYNDLISDQPDLIIPHPRLHLRRFTLVPLEEIAAGFLHPVFRKTITELLMECQDEGRVSLYKG